MKRRSLTPTERVDWLRLSRTSGGGPVTFAKLIERFETASRAIDALPDLSKRGGRAKPLKAIARDQAEDELADIENFGARLLCACEAEFPSDLAALDPPPPVITVKGPLLLSDKPVCAMVGARNASAAAVKLARDFAAALAEAGFAVVSGLARGIDGAAHEGALPHTIGVIASGIDIAYPPQHADLQERIASEGLLLAEQPPGTEPRGSHFPSRNRIIAGLAAGTLVVEAAVRSGSLITARLAGEAGREVMAIPGSPLEPRSHGCNHLIREGAVLVQSPEEVIELLTGFDGAPRSTFRECGQEFAPPMSEELAHAEPAAIADRLTSAPVAVDELIRQSGESAAGVQLALLELEIAGRLERHAGGRVSLR